MKKIAAGIVFILGGTVYTNDSYACPACSQTGQYGSNVVGQVGKNTTRLTKTSTNLGASFAKTTNALLKTGQDIVGAIQANASTLAATMEISRKIESDMITELKEQVERMEQGRIVAENNLGVAKSQGAQNVPASVCDDYASSIAQVTTDQMVQTLRAQFKEAQIADRKQSFRDGPSNPIMMDLADVSSGEFNETTAALALEQAQMITGEASFPVSPDTIALTAASSGNTASTQLVVASWLRSSTASTDMGEQILKRTTPSIGDLPEGQEAPVSLMDELSQKVDSGLSSQAALEDSSASEAKLLKNISRGLALNNKLKLEILMNTLASNRMLASQVGYANDSALITITGQLEAELQQSGTEQ